MTTIEPVVEVARAAKARGLPIAVASGGSTSNVRTGLASTGILHLFDAVVCAEVRQAPNLDLSNVSRPHCYNVTAHDTTPAACADVRLDTGGAEYPLATSNASSASRAPLGPAIQDDACDVFHTAPDLMRCSLWPIGTP